MIQRLNTLFCHNFNYVLNIPITKNCSFMNMAVQSWTFQNVKRNYCFPRLVETLIYTEIVTMHAAVRMSNT